MSRANHPLHIAKGSLNCQTRQILTAYASSHISFSLVDMSLSENEELTAEEIQEEVAGLCDDFWNNRSGDPDIHFGTSEIAWLRKYSPGTYETWQAAWDARHRKPTRSEIVQKMNYHMGLGGDDYADPFNDGLRQILAEAITLPRDTDYAAHFEQKKLERLRWYFRLNRHDNPVSRPSALDIEALFPEETQQDVPWGVRSGQVAAVRWLTDEDRQCAEDFFPMLDS